MDLDLHIRGTTGASLRGHAAERILGTLDRFRHRLLGIQAWIEQDRRAGCRVRLAAHLADGGQVLAVSDHQRPLAAVGAALASVRRKLAELSSGLPAPKRRRARTVRGKETRPVLT